MALNVRRVVTGHDASGKSVVRTDELVTAAHHRQTRTVALSGDQLTLRTPPSFAINGDQQPAELTWIREAA